MNLDIKNKILELAKKNETPFYAFDLQEVENKYQAIKNGLDQAKLFYALKANSEMPVLRKLNELGAGFEIASKEELQKFIDLGVKPERIVFGNPVKKIPDIKFASDYGLKYFVFDNLAEFEKIEKYAQDPKFILRINVSDLSKNIHIDFGATLADIKKMFKQIKFFSSRVKGLTFYGDIKPAIIRCLKIRNELFPQLDLINIGGGFQDKDEDLQYFQEINELMARINEKYGVRFYAEPGLYIVNSSGYLLSRVLSSGLRNGKYFVYLDAGKPAGLIGEEAEFDWEILSQASPGEKVEKIYFYGPTCDNMVLFSRDNISLPQVDDFVLFKNIGAYSLCYANNFHAFNKPANLYL